ncbi:MAG TPA: hypothetical protein VG778_10005 [Blastocatellia bacterium]|jgi:hypothetical protein|nr:hypothetical protein [Blastocatellia bacterium]
MSAVFKQVKEKGIVMWECKDCHLPVPEAETMAYHLVNQILYGWCEACFGTRSERAQAA